jgi:prepilin-type N-terminal cleavage/methylation domain-containing protein
MRQAKLQDGFTMIEIMIVVLLVGVLAAIAVPNFIKSRTSAQTNVCINNLKAIDYAIQQWALEQKKASSAPVEFTDISSYLRNVVNCPAGGGSFSDSYWISAVGVEPICQRVPGAHLLAQSATDSSTSTPSNGSPTSQGSPTAGPSSGNNGNGNGNNGNGNSGNGNGTGNGGIGNGNGNGNVP